MSEEDQLCLRAGFGPTSVAILYFQGPAPIPPRLSETMWGEVEIIFLLAGLVCVALGLAIIVVEVRARRGTEPRPAIVAGFSSGRSANPNLSSFHTVALYSAANGRKYYVVAAAGSSAPLHTEGQPVTVLADPRDPENAVLKSSLSYVLGAAIALMGVVLVAVFAATFQPGPYSLAVAAVVVAGFFLKIRKAWRSPPITLRDWQDYRRGILATKVLPEDSKDEIRWIDPLRAIAAVEAHRKANRFVVPVVTVTGVILSLVAFGIHLRTQEFLNTAQPASGLVVDLEERNSGDGSTYAAVVKFTDARGQQVTFVDSFSSMPPTYSPGQQVAVLYHPESPAKSQIDRGLANHWLTALAGLPGGLLLVSGLYAARRRFRSAGLR